MQYIRNRENYERGGVCGNLLYYMLKSSALTMSVSNIKIFSCFLFRVFIFVLSLNICYEHISKVFLYIYDSLNSYQFQHLGYYAISFCFFFLTSSLTVGLNLDMSNISFYINYWEWCSVETLDFLIFFWRMFFLDKMKHVFLMMGSSWNCSVLPKFWLFLFCPRDWNLAYEFTFKECAFIHT